MITARGKTPKIVHRLNLYIEDSEFTAIQDYADANEIALGAAARELIQIGDTCHALECPAARAE